MRPRVSILSRREMEEIHLAILETLEKIGTVVLNEEALKILKDAGCEVDEKTKLVKIPSSLVEESIRVAPRYVHLYGRDPSYKVKLQEDRYYTVLGSTTPYVLDPETWERRRGTESYVALGARIADALPNIHISTQCCLALDVSPEVQDVHELAAVFTNTTKPVMVLAYSPEGVRKIIEIAATIRGGEKKLRKEPLLFVYAEPTSPLQNSREALGNLIETVKAELPVLYAPVASGGGTSPVTLAGALVQSLAESLVGNVVAQLVRKGTPFILGHVDSITDMKSGVHAYGAPELSMLDVAGADMAHYYGLPFFGTGGCTDSKLPDEQAVAEATASMLMAMLSGTNLIHDIGYIESAMTISFELVVMANEIFPMLNRIVRGFEVDDESLALDVIRDVGPGGHFLAHKHTLKHMKENWIPELMDRKRYDHWKKEGAKTLLARAKEKLAKIIKEHEPEPLPKDVLEDVQKIVKDWDAQRLKR